MPKRHAAAKLQNVLLVDDDDVQVNVTRRGERALHQPCQLTIAINGEEPISFLEEAGIAAPLSAIVNLGAPTDITSSLRNALKTKPWHHTDTPVIFFSQSTERKTGTKSDPAMIGYLVKNRPISDLIETIRETLDLDPMTN